MPDPNYTTIADAFETLAAEFRKLAPAPTPTPPQPVGPQTPILTDARLAVLRKMQGENHACWQMLKAYADKTVVGTPAYDDLGQAAAIVYRVTGDKSYAAAAWAQLQKVMANDGRAANDVKQRYADYQLVFTWVKDTLTAEQIAAFGTTIKAWSDYCLGVNQPQYTGSFRLNDSDQTVGQFFGLALQDALQIPPGNLLQQNIVNLGTGKLGAPVGGLTATAADTSSVRNTLNWYVSTLAKGGEWPESSQYDLNTVGQLVIPGWLAHWDATGANSFPEIATYIPTACQAALVDWTPGLEQRVLWGDNDAQTSGGPNLYKAMPYLAALQVAANRVGATTEAAQIGALILALQATYPAALAQAEVHFFYFADPYDPTQAFRTPTVLQSNYSPGVGLYRRIDGDKLFFGFSPSRLDIDHEFTLVGDLRLWANGEWVIREPISYGGTGTAATANSFTVSGLSAMYAKGIVGFDECQEWTYLDYLSSGPLYGPGESWNPPPVFCSEMRRRVLYLPTANTIFLCDRLNSTDPAADRPDFQGYQLADEAAIKAAAHRHQWFWNCPTQPTMGNGTFGYKTPGGQVVEFDYFASAPMRATAYDQTKSWATLGIPANQLAWGVTINPTTDQQFDWLLWCIRLDPSASVPTLVQPKPGVAGVAVDGYTVLFSVDQNNPSPTPYTAAGKTYFVGCPGQPAIKQ